MEGILNLCYLLGCYRNAQQGDEREEDDDVRGLYTSERLMVLTRSAVH
jgi:hypothetical protein